MNRRQFIIASALAALTGCGEPEPKPFNEALPVKPQIPPMPEVARENVQLIIGIDITRSEIRKELPGVLKATEDFLKETKLLESGDKISICEVSDNARCNSFEKGKNDDALLKKNSICQTA